ncbi:MAG TPA: hypothetical protein PLQ93_10825, partial [Bacteroidia bacterium]|nr:hypothetical protein [Bacteroidia bacterium]
MFCLLQLPEVLGQCSFTTAIIPSGSINLCSGNNVVLSPSTLSDSWTQKSNVGGQGRAMAVGFNIGS